MNSKYSLSNSWFDSLGFHKEARVKFTVVWGIIIMHPQIPCNIIYALKYPSKLNLLFFEISK